MPDRIFFCAPFFEVAQEMILQGRGSNWRIFKECVFLAFFSLDDDDVNTQKKRKKHDVFTHATQANAVETRTM